MLNIYSEELHTHTHSIISASVYLMDSSLRVKIEIHYRCQMTPADLSPSLSLSVSSSLPLSHKVICQQ